MSLATIQPKTPAAAAANLQEIGAAMAARNAAAPTIGLIPGAADEVSALTATQFAAHGATYRAVSAQAAAIHHMFTAIVAVGEETSCLS
ncbi:PE family protein [Mycobacterium intracellulare]|uniref:PE family protein n=1 Tax=Mycobacterium intracellulare TaxID=1767 RepID=UPI0006CA9EBE|nr:PE family protein [Mycobacterium intracellulare]KPN45970.1 PE family protein [Mycobacterium intracellulare subsp. chimaera]